MNAWGPFLLVLCAWTCWGEHHQLECTLLNAFEIHINCVLFLITGIYSRSLWNKPFCGWAENCVTFLSCLLLPVMVSFFFASTFSSPALFCCVQFLLRFSLLTFQAEYTSFFSFCSFQCYAESYEWLATVYLEGRCISVKLCLGYIHFMKNWET